MSWLKRVLLWVMGLFYVFGGVLHLVRPDFYRPMMPPYLPAHDFLIWLSGVAELGLGLLVIDPLTRRWAAWGIIALLIAIFPANLHIALNDVPVFGNTEGGGTMNWVRLPFQAVFILWAWWYTRPDGDGEVAQVRQPSRGDFWVSKPEILRRLDRLSRDRDAMTAALAVMEQQPDVPLLSVGLQHGYVEATPGERDHLANDILGRDAAWFKDLPEVEPIVRAACIRAWRLALETGLPLDTYWLRGGDRFEIAIRKGEQSIVMLVHSPHPPVAGKFVARDLVDLWLFQDRGVEVVGPMIGRT